MAAARDSTCAYKLPDPCAALMFSIPRAFIEFPGSTLRIGLRPPHLYAMRVEILLGVHDQLAARPTFRARIRPCPGCANWRQGICKRAQLLL